MLRLQPYSPVMKALSSFGFHFFLWRPSGFFRHYHQRVCDPVWLCCAWILIISHVSFCWLGVIRIDDCLSAFLASLSKACASFFQVLWEIFILFSIPFLIPRCIAHSFSFFDKRFFTPLAQQIARVRLINGSIPTRSLPSRFSQLASLPLLFLLLLIIKTSCWSRPPVLCFCCAPIFKYSPLYEMWSFMSRFLYPGVMPCILDYFVSLSLYLFISLSLCLFAFWSCNQISLMEGHTCNSAELCPASTQVVQDTWNISGIPWC
jgi:hypothetical protein